MDHTRRHLVTALVALGAAALPTRMARAGAPARAAPGDDAHRTEGREALVARSADGTALAGEAVGEPGAPEILFIHGLRQSRLSWDKQFADPALAAFRLVRFDLRGHGDSDKPDALAAYADPDRWANDVAAVIAAAKLRRPVLVGWSLGGYVAAAYQPALGLGSANDAPGGAVLDAARRVQCLELGQDAGPKAPPLSETSPAARSMLLNRRHTRAFCTATVGIVTSAPSDPFDAVPGLSGDEGWHTLRQVCRRRLYRDRCLLAPIGNVPRAKADARHHARAGERATTARPTRRVSGEPGLCPDRQGTRGTGIAHREA